jgi:IS30 family transposase
MGQENNTLKKRKWKQISEKERYQIEILSKRGIPPKEIGKQLGRDRRTIEREIAQGMTLQRNSDLTEKIVYLADAGQRVHDEKAANKGRGLKIGHDHKLAEYIEEKIGKERMSPDAVIGEIKAKELNFETSICTKTVYNYLDKGIFLGISNKDLPVKRNRRKHKYRKTRTVALNNIKGRSIDERPDKIELREELGHWEMDCVVGKQGTKACLLVLTERRSRNELIFKLKAKKQEYVIAEIDKLERKYKGRFNKIFKTITMDNGGEFLDWKAIERSCINEKQRTICYYAHPYSAWERGSNENNNKLIRRFVPKGTNIEKLTKQDIKRIEHWINNYPRRMFGYKSANDIFYAA